MDLVTNSSLALVAHQVRPTDPGSAATMFDLHPDQPHPAEVVVAALLRRRAVGLSDGHCYQLGEDLRLGRIGGPEQDGLTTTNELLVGDFLRLCAQLTFDEMRDIAHGKACAVEARHSTAGAARAVNVADPGSAARMFALHPTRKHPAEVVLGALLRARSVDLGDRHCYRLGVDLAWATSASDRRTTAGSWSPTRCRSALSGDGRSAVIRD